MTKASIAIDLDDVLSNHVEAFVNFSNSHYGTNLTIEDYEEDWPEMWQVSLAETKKRAYEFNVPEVIASFEVKKESIAALLKLKENYDLYIITTRFEHLKDITNEWIDKYFPGIFKEVRLIPFWFSKNKLTKADICKQIGAKYLVDDHSSHCYKAAEAGIEVVLFGDYSWNRHASLKKGISRCKNWNEVVKYFETRVK